MSIVVAVAVAAVVVGLLGVLRPPAGDDPPDRRGRRPGRVRGGLAVIAIGVTAALVGGRLAAAAEAPVGLGTAAAYAVLAGQTVTNTGPTTITGDLGVSPGSAVTGFPPGIVTGSGSIHVADAAALQAQADVTTAYNDAAGRTATATITADLGGQTFGPGVYAGGTLGLTGTVTLNAQGDPNAVFVFQAASTLIVETGGTVALTGGASACNVFWQVGSSATLKTDSVVAGTILAQASVDANTRAAVTGRLLARTAAVTLDSNVITVPVCAAAPPATTTTTTSTTTTTTTVPATTTTVPATTTTAPTPATTTTAPITSTTASAASTTQPAPGPGEGATTTTAPGAGASPPATTRPGSPGSPGGPGTPGAGAPPGLPVTGKRVTVPLAAGLAAVTVGAAMLVASRRLATGARPRG
jgi:hypothetical protein